MAKHVTVIAAGIDGVCTASYLQRAGCTVRLIDAAAPGRAASYGNAGGLSSGSFIPIAYPGIIKDVPKWLMDKNGPLVVRPAYLPQALPWLARILLASRPKEFEKSAIALKALTMSLFDNLVTLARSAGAEHLIRRVGQLHLYSTDEGFASDARGRDLRKANGVTLDILGADEIRQMEPDLAPIFKHAVYFPEHGHCANPLGLTEALAEELVRNCAEIVEARVTGIAVGPEGARALETSAGRSVPVIGRSIKSRNVTFAFGYGHIGLITAASTGRLVSEIVTGQPTSIDPAPYSIDRF